jgi:hypothetical protein
MNIETIKTAISTLSDEATLSDLYDLQEALFSHVMRSQTLEELASLLSLQSDLFSSISSEYRHELGVQSGSWIMDLPVFSENAPDCTVGVWSWDDTHAITGEGWAQWEIVEREA